MKVDKLYDLVQPKETDKVGEDGKPITRWQNLGIAFYKDGEITGIKMEALPIPNKDGEIWLRLFEKKPKAGGSDNSGGSSPW